MSLSSSPTIGWTLHDWQRAYQQGQQPEVLLTALLESLDSNDPAWISVLDTEQLAAICQQLAGLKQQAGGDLTQLPLFGVPFAVKDNIDVLGFATTAACPAYAYAPDKDAPVVALLRAAGAIPIGKTNLDQFATGLVGTRSPYGAVPNSFKPEIISGGSSSGSASVVARGLVPFGLGTDTAGSGRVPAGLNNIVGLKPTRGALSIAGVVPACRSLDCVSIFTLTLSDAAQVYQQVNHYQADDAFSRLRPHALASEGPAIRRPGAIKRLGFPAQPQWFADQGWQDNHYKNAWQAALDRWQALDLELVPVDFTPLWKLAALLYEGPWVAERHAAIADFMAAQGDAMNPVVRGIISNTQKFSATDTFNFQYRKAELLRQIDGLLQEIDALLVPTAPIAPSIAQIDAEPVKLNSWLGTYTNFVNLADFCALAIPAGFASDGLPFGVTLISGAWKDESLQTLAAHWLNAQPTPLGATDKTRQTEQPPTTDSQDTIAVAVVGAHLSGMPLNGQLTERNARLLEQTTTSKHYRLFALPNTTPPKPGLQRVADKGESIVLEVWKMPTSALGSFVGLIPPPLGIGSVELADGRWVKGFICEGYAVAGANDVTEYGGWRAYIKAQQTQSK